MSLYPVNLGFYGLECLTLTDVRRPYLFGFQTLPYY